MRKIEILAPAGSYEGMQAAMNAGCDAVYIGGSSYGARAYADNPKEDALLRAIDEAHIRGKRLYLTVNTLLKENELTQGLYRFLEKFYLQGLDAVIVQDVGVMNFIHRNFPGLPIHASTQMTLTMAPGANLLKEQGVTRLVTARELSFQEIRAIRENTALEIETFVHGALCYCYSGQCLMSSLIGGRSGNRGRCAQPCRMPYQFDFEDRREGNGKGKYLLSPKDINTIEFIPELVESGVDSFKIEGRMKRPEYAAAVTAMYRKYLDLYLELGKEDYRKLLCGPAYEKDMLLLQDVYNRGGFSGGYGNTYHGKSMMSLYRPNHSGVYVGEVETVKESRVSIRLREEVHAQDILEIRSREEEGYEFTVKNPHDKGALLETNVGIRRDAAPKEKKQSLEIKTGMQVYRTKNNELLESLSREYLAEQKRLGIRGLLTARLGERLSLTVWYKEFTVTAYQDIVQEAIRQPMDKERLTAPIYKTGDTLYYFEELQTQADENIFVPVAWLNEIRREALDKLKEAVTGHYRRGAEGKHGGVNREEPENAMEKPEKAAEKQEDTVQSPSLCVVVQTKEQLETALEFPEINEIIAEYDRFEPSVLLRMAKQAEDRKKGFYLALPAVCRLSVYRRLEKELYEIIDNGCITGFLAKNFEEVSLLKSLLKNRIDKEIRLNHNLYLFNKEAKSFWSELGISRFTAPIELNYQELMQLGLADFDLLVYGYLPLMLSAQCLLDNTAGCRKSGQNHSGFLTDRMGKKFFLQTSCGNCCNTLYNGQPLALHKQTKEIAGLHPRSLRMDFTLETGQQMKQIINVFIQAFYRGSVSPEGPLEYTTGHFKRGVV